MKNCLVEYPVASQASRSLVTQLVCVAVMCCACCATFQSSGQGMLQITFDGPPAQPPDSSYLVTNYYESGMVFRPLPSSQGFARTGANLMGGNPRSFFPDDGSAYLQTLIIPAETLGFSFTNGSLFSLLTVDLAEYSTVRPNAVTVQFVGYHPDGSTVTTSFTTDGIIDGTGPLADFQTFSFNGLGFSNLTRVEMPTSGWSLDNLVVVAPEPATTSLLGFVAVTLFGHAVRKRRHRRVP